MAKNKKWSAVAKFEIVPQALKADCTLNEICTRYQVAPSRLHAVHPYLLRDLSIDRANQAWMVDITYLRMPRGFMYLVAFVERQLSFPAGKDNCRSIVVR